MGYEAEFVGVDRGIIGRAASGVQGLANNSPVKLNIEPGSTNHHVLENSTLWGPHGVRGVGLPPLPGWNTSTASALVDNSESKRLTNRDVVDEGEQLQERQSDSLSSRTVYVSINTCSQPQPDGTITGEPPQLALYISQSANNTKPGPDKLDQQEVVPLDEGLAIWTADATGDLHISVSAPVLSGTAFSGIWSYELAASIDAPYHASHGQDPNNTFLYLVDSDTNSALLVTDNLTTPDANDTIRGQWMNFAPQTSPQPALWPFDLFVFNQNNAAVRGLRNSFCGLQQLDKRHVVASKASMTQRGLDNTPKEQFHVQGLNSSSGYSAILAMSGNSTSSGANVIGGGGSVWAARTFRTKTSPNCQLIFDLPFCTSVAYAVPTNGTISATDLVSLYDSAAQSYYQAFNYSLQQIPCDTTNTAQYSLARNCADCARAYKTWLCAVTVPRCADLDLSPSAPDGGAYLMPRGIGAAFPNGSTLDLSAITLRDPSVPRRAGRRDDDENNNTASSSANASSMTAHAWTNAARNSLVDTQLAPGPHAELLPCADLCHALVQSCPAALGFACPGPGKGGLEKSYGFRKGVGRDGEPRCNSPGAVYSAKGPASGAARAATVGVRGWFGVVVVLGVVGVVM